MEIDLNQIFFQIVSEHSEFIDMKIVEALEKMPLQEIMDKIIETRMISNFDKLAESYLSRLSYKLIEKEISKKVPRIYKEFKAKIDIFIYRQMKDYINSDEFKRGLFKRLKG
jgi:hypothetical protein